MRNQDKLIEFCKANQTMPTEEKVLKFLAETGKRPTEIGWVLHHVFGISMQEAVHKATVYQKERAGPEEEVMLNQDQLIEFYKANRAMITEEEVLQSLADSGQRPTEIGWVLHHVFGISMPEAVHKATVYLEGQKG
jgi:16S rRNA C967 or C1407 C5-methylase (RsmB/RsmF family)